MYINHLSSENVLTIGSSSKQENALNNLNYCNHKFAAKLMLTILSFLVSVSLRCVSVGVNVWEQLHILSFFVHKIITVGEYHTVLQ
jgi:hypothetical protein